MQLFKDYLRQYGPLAILLITCVSLPLYSGVRSYEPAQVNLQVPEPKQVALNDLLPLLQQIAQKPAEVKESPVKYADPMVEVIKRLEQSQQKFYQQIVERDRRMSEQLTEFISSSYRGGSKVDRSGNTKEQLEDIYQDANVPQLPDPLVKGLAANPGARATIHPDHGQPVIAVTEWGVSNYGGGKQLNLLRHNGRVYGQTIIHGNQAVQQQGQPEPPKPEPFRLSLGNN